MHEATPTGRSQSKQRASGILVGIKRGIRTGNRTQDVSTLRAERSFQLSYAGTRCTVPAERSSLYHQWPTTCNLDIYRLPRTIRGLVCYPAAPTSAEDEEEEETTKSCCCSCLRYIFYGLCSRFMQFHTDMAQRHTSQGPHHVLGRVRCTEQGCSELIPLSWHAGKSAVAIQSGGNKTMSASERWRRKKAGQDDGQQGNQQQVTDLTELANRLLTETGNMDIYQESYEHISKLSVSEDVDPLKESDVHGLLLPHNLHFEEQSALRHYTAEDLNSDTLLYRTHVIKTIMLYSIQ
ncbi:uncharacterized protein [Periplaneta americana]|uniref:uncharacterized protein isoform X3 n=1 Tax=Periplaneta americana TaxID=6978 RepID=UPI0037E97135